MPVKIISLNANSLIRASRRSLLSDFVRGTGGDVFLIQETQLAAAIPLRVEGYWVFRADQRRGWGGVAMLIGKAIPVRNVCCRAEPIQSISVDCMIGGVWRRFSSLYVPHGLARPLDAFRLTLNGMAGSICGGDFNARHTAFGDDRANTYGEALHQFIGETASCFLHPPAPTCYHAQRGSFIDKFLLPTGQMSTPIEMIPSFSDHAAISIDLPIERMGPAAAPLLRMFHLADIGRINKHLSRATTALNMPTDRDIGEDECEKIAVTLGAAMRDAVDKFVPLNRMSGRSVILSPTTRALQRRAKDIQRKLFRFRGLAPEEEHRQLVRDLKMLKAMIVRNVNAESARFFTERFDQVESNRDAFRTIKRYTGHKTRARFGGALYADCDKTTILGGAPAVAEALAEQFDLNHRLTADTISTDDCAAKHMAETFRERDLRIFFSGPITADIATNRRSLDTDRLLPFQHRGLLVSLP